MKPFSALMFVVALAGAGGVGWCIRDAAHTHDAPAAGMSRRVRFYQSPMHPWIKQDQPGLCTICGMKLVAVYEGDDEFRAASVITLASNTPSIAGIATTPIERRPITRTMRVAGTIDDDDTRHRIVTAYVEGRLEEMPVHHEGAEVKAGDPLATFYSAGLLASVREYLALAASPESKSSLATAAALRLRQMGLGEAQIAALPSTFKADSTTLPLLSPVSGTVVKRIAYAGQFVREGEPLFELADFAVMWFRFDAYERDLPWLRIGQRVVVTTPSLPGKALTNTIAFIDPNLDAVSRTLRVRVELQNPLVGEGTDRARLLKHRLYAEGRIEVASGPVLAVPRAAVLNPDGRPFVWKSVGSSSYERREVVLGRRGDEDWELVSGLDPGDRVVSSGGFLVDAQAQLQHVEAPALSPAGAVATNGVPIPAPAVAPPTDAQWLAVGEALKASVQMSAALASDDMKAFHRAWPARVAASRRLAGLGNGTRKDVFADLEALPAEPADLASARAALNRSMDALMPWASRLKERAGFGELKAYRCPMTRKSFPDAPPEARWLQLKGPKQNPWFGADMLDCGTEIPL